MADTVGGGRGAEIVNDGLEIAKKTFPTHATFTRAVAPAVCEFGRVTGWVPSFGVEARSVVWKEAPLSVEREIATLAQEIGARFVPATLHVTVCVEAAGQLTADAGAVIVNGPAVAREVTVVVSEFTPPPPPRLSRAVRRKFIVRFVVGDVSPYVVVPERTSESFGKVRVPPTVGLKLRKIGRLPESTSGGAGSTVPRSNSSQP
jgi:hypothetical protein